MRISSVVLPVVVALLLHGLMPSFAVAVDVGDAVEFQRAGQTFTGKITSVRPGGQFVEVETTAGGQTRKIIVKSDSVKVLPSSGLSGMRTWSDQSGQFKIEATMESQTAFEIVLRKADGTQIKVPLDKLSAADQEYVATLDSSVGAAPENPFVAGAMSSSSPASAPSPAATGGLTLPPPKSYTKTGELLIEKLTAANGFQPDPSAVDLSDVGTASMGIPPVEEGERAPHWPMVIGPDGASLCYDVLSDTRAPQAYTKIYLINAQKRTAREVGRIDGYRIWMCASEPVSGNVLGAVLEPGSDKAKSLCVIGGIREGKPRIRSHWRMFPGDDRAANYVTYRKLLPNGIALTFFSGRVQAFDVGASREAWSMSAKAFNEPSVSPGGRYAAVMADDQCAIVETKTGKQVQSIPVNGKLGTSAGFSSDATRLAVVQDLQARVFDVMKAEEQMVHESTVPIGGLGKRILWLEDKFLLLPTGSLLDVDRNLIIWKYMIAQDAIEYCDLEHHGLLMFNGRNSFSVVRLPHDGARKEADRDTTGISAVGPGDTISVSANVSAPGINSADVQQSLNQAAADAGYQVGSSGAAQLVASITRGKTKTEKYRIMGFGFDIQEVTYTPYISRVEVRHNGKSLWQQSRSTGVPFRIPAGKTLQQATTDAERPDPKFFRNIKLPRQILKPEYQNGFGTSQVNERGITDRK